MKRFLLLVALTLGAASGAAGAPVTITYGVVSWNPFHWVVMVGTARGQFEKHGVKLDIPMTGSSGAAVQALIGGSLDMTTTSPGAAFLAQAHDCPPALLMRFSCANTRWLGSLSFASSFS